MIDFKTVSPLDATWDKTDPIFLLFIFLLWDFKLPQILETSLNNVESF